MAQVSDFGLSLHGFPGTEADFCVGGGNAAARAALVKKLSEEIPEFRSCDICCNPYNGVARKNPVNLCHEKGVQIEMSPAVRRKILSDLSFRTRTGKVLRSFLSEYP
jgi:phage replication-related protein YjqB (UPF0714/DUF867 family)